MKFLGTSMTGLIGRPLQCNNLIAMTEGDIDRAVSLVTHNIIRAADIAIPKSSGHPRRHCRPWWNENCQIAIKRQQKA